jgi:hypothetical protein
MSKHQVMVLVYHLSVCPKTTKKNTTMNRKNNPNSQHPSQPIRPRRQDLRRLIQIHRKTSSGLTGGNMPDLRIILGVLAALLTYSAALLKLNGWMNRRRRKQEGKGSSETDADELFPNGDRRKFRAAIARLEERDLRRETAIERIELDVQEISARLRGRGI